MSAAAEESKDVDMVDATKTTTIEVRRFPILLFRCNVDEKCCIRRYANTCFSASDSYIWVSSHKNDCCGYIYSL